MSYHVEHSGHLIQAKGCFYTDSGSKEAGRLRVTHLMGPGLGEASLTSVLGYESVKKLDERWIGVMDV